MKKRSQKEATSTDLTLSELIHGLDTSMDGIGITDEEGKFIFANEAHAAMYGYTKEELLNSTWHICYDESTLNGILTSATSGLHKYGHWRGEVVGIKKDGTTFPQELTLSKINKTNRLVCVVRDISELKAKEQYIEFTATHNELSSLPNRRTMITELTKLGKETQSISVLFMDVDRLKTVNDTLGHKIGDLLLQRIGERLKGFQSEFVSIYHISGDEFIVVIKNIKDDMIRNMVDGITRKLKEPYFIEGNEIYSTFSIGISRYPEDTQNIEELIKLADTAMYSAKEQGKNNYQLFNIHLKEKLHRKMMVENQLRKAIYKEELLLHFQPKVELDSFKLKGLEALLRWNHPVLGTISPIEFIPIAEETGLIIDIGRWVIKEVLLQMKQWKQKGIPLVKVSVNVSQRQFRDKNLCDFIETTIRNAEIDPKFFEIEITESVMEDFELVIPLLNKLKRIGIGISIDDFGTGYSSLNFLKQLPVDTLKIDRSFIRDGLLNRRDLALVKSIIDIGENLELAVIAEGIETEEDLNALKQIKCNLGQGYFFSAPLSVKDVEVKFLVSSTISN